MNPFRTGFSQWQTALRVPGLLRGQAPLQHPGLGRGCPQLWDKLARDQQQDPTAGRGGDIQQHLPEERLESGLKQASCQEGGQPWGLTNPCPVPLSGCQPAAAAGMSLVRAGREFSLSLICPRPWAGLGSETSFSCYKQGQVSC